MMTPTGIAEPERVARAAAACGLPGARAVAPTEPLNESAWRELLGRARTDRSSGVLLEAVDRGTWPATADQRQQLLELHTRALAESLVLERTLLEVSGRLTSAGVDHRVLKGAAVAHLDYADPGLRTFGDVDLLVRSDDVDTVGTLLEGERVEPPARPGFDRRFGKSATYRLASGHEIDVHRTLVMGPYGLTVHLPDLWIDPVEFELGGRVLLGLGECARLLHTAYACVLSDFPPRAHPRRDLAEMLLFGQHVAADVVAMASRWRAEAVLATAVTETWERFGLADVTALTAWAASYRVSGKDADLLSLYRRADAPYAKLALHSLPLLDGWGDRWAFTRSLAFPDTAFLDKRGMSLRTYLWRGSRRAIRGRG